MSNSGLNDYKPALYVGIGIFVVAFAMLMFMGNYGFIASVFMALLLALLSAIVYYLAFLTGEQRAALGAKASGSGTSEGNVAGAGADPTADDRATADAAARKAADEKAAADEAARKAAEEKAAADAAEQKAAEEKAAADEAARKAAEDKAAAEAAEAAASEAAESAEAASEPATSDNAGTEDYDGDGVLEGTDEGTQPAGLDGPRDGTADDLKQIKGVGPKLEALLNRMGFWHFDQVAGWSADEVAWVDANLEGFKGRVSRDKWVEQAGVLASGGETEFSKRVEDGDVY